MAIRRAMARTRTLLADRRGAVTILAAAGMFMLMGMGALAIDLGSVYYESRRLQGIADAAALSAAGNIGTAAASARSAVAAAGWSRTIASEVTTGVYTPDGDKSVTQRFLPSAASPNAAKVTVTADAPLYLGRVMGLASVHLVRTATAARVDLASFSIGSRLAALDQGIANQLLSGLTGSSVSLSVADYNALLGADIDLLGYTSALKTELGLTAGSFNTVLATTTTLPHALNALQAALNAAGNVAAATAIGKIAAAAPSGAILPSALIDLGRIGGQDRAAGGSSIDVNAYNMLTSLLQAANGTRQINLNLGASIAGLSSVNAVIVMGDRMQNSPWIAVTNTGSPIVSTAQTRIYLQATALATPALGALGIGSLRFPLYMELGAAKARLSSLSCSQTGRSATLDVQTSIGHAAIADIDTAALSTMAAAPVENPATFIDLPGIARISGLAQVQSSSAGWQSVSFNTAEIDAQTTKTVSSSGIAGAVAASLTSGISLTATAGPLSIPAPSVSALAKPILATMAPSLDGLLANLLDMLGIHLGQADVRINGVRCGSASLVA